MVSQRCSASATSDGSTDKVVDDTILMEVTAPVLEPHVNSMSAVTTHHSSISYAPGRKSSLHAPTMLFTGHSGPVYACQFDASGAVIATGGMDKGIFLWNVSGNENNNFNVLRGHKNAVLQLHWTSQGNQIVTCSADKSVCLWDAHKGQRIMKLNEHSGIVNCCAVAGKLCPDMIVSGSDDCTAVIWDVRQQQPKSTLFLDYQVTTVALSTDGQTAYTGGIDNIIRVWDLRHGEPDDPLIELSGHSDTITGLALSPDGTTLLSNGMEGAMRSWNVRPFVAAVTDPSVREQGHARQERLFLGHRHGAEKSLLRCAWSPDGMQVTSGSADRNVHIWDAQTCEPLYCLPGHTGSVNDVTFHPYEPIVASCSTDKQVWLGELD
jgi:Prp8 binding protein